MRTQQRFHAVVCELRSEFTNCARRISEEARDRCRHAALRSAAFDEDAVEDFDLIEMLTLGFKELPPLVNSCFDNGVVICCERYVRTVRLEEVLVNMEAWAKDFQRYLQPLHRILLFGAVKTFVVHAGNPENHADITALGEEGPLIPESVQVDVVVKSRTFFPRPDDLVDA